MLPKKIYPELDDDPLNLVPTCVPCQGLKSDWDPNTVQPQLYAANENRIRDEETQRTFILRAKEEIGNRPKRRVDDFVNGRGLENWVEALERVR